MCVLDRRGTRRGGILKSRLRELLNYYRMDSAQDSAILFEQLVFVFLGMLDCNKDKQIKDFRSTSNDEVRIEYLQVFQAGKNSSLGKELQSTSPEFASKPELIRRLLDTATYLCEFFYSAHREFIGLTLINFFEEILGERRGGTLFTPFQLANELVRLIATNDQMGMIPQSILDPASGSGAFLIAANKYFSEQVQTLGNPELIAVEQDEQVARCMQMLFAFFKLRVAIKNENWLLSKQVVQYDVILANPPFHTASLRNSMDINLDELPVQTRDMHRAFVQKTLLPLKNGGSCVIIVPDSFLLNTNGDAIAIRRWLLENYYFEGIIKLPEYTFYPQAQVKSSVMFLKKPVLGYGGANEKNGIFFFQVDADGKSQDSRRQKISQNDFEELRQVWELRSKWAETWFQAADENPEHKNMYGAHTPAVWKNERFWFATLEQIAQKDYILLPERYRPDSTTERLGEEPAIILQDLINLQDEIKDLMSRLSGMVNDDE